MRHTLRLQNVIVGHSELEHVDFEVRRAWGVFRPGLGYELVQPVFQLFADSQAPDGTTKNAEKLERYYRARDALHLEIRDGQGHPIRTSAIHIVDGRSAPGTGVLEIDVLIN